MIQRAKGLRLAVWPEGNDAVAGTVAGILDELVQEGCVDPGHIAGDHYVPGREILQESRVDASCGTARRDGVRRNRIAQAGVKVWVSNDVNGIGNLQHGSRQDAGQRLAQVRQQRFVPAHAAALAPSQHESGNPHERILALRPQRDPMLEKELFPV